MLNAIFFFNGTTIRSTCSRKPRRSQSNCLLTQYIYVFRYTKNGAATHRKLLLFCIPNSRYMTLFRCRTSICCKDGEWWSIVLVMWCRERTKQCETEKKRFACNSSTLHSVQQLNRFRFGNLLYIILNGFCATFFSFKFESSTLYSTRMPSILRSNRFHLLLCFACRFRDEIWRWMLTQNQYRFSICAYQEVHCKCEMKRASLKDG